MNSIKGIKWPLQFHNGRLAVSTDDQHIKESVHQIVGTAKGEIPMRPNFGCDLQRRVFDPVNVAMLAESDIREALNRYEPRVDVLDTSADISSSALGVVGITVEFSIRGEDTPLEVTTTIGG